MRTPRRLLRKAWDLSDLPERTFGIPFACFPPRRELSEFGPLVGRPSGLVPDREKRKFLEATLIGEQALRQNWGKGVYVSEGWKCLLMRSSKIF